MYGSSGNVSNFDIRGNAQAMLMWWGWVVVVLKARMSCKLGLAKNQSNQNSFKYFLYQIQVVVYLVVCMQQATYVEIS